MSQGWIKLHRKLLNWEWFKSPKMVHLFLYLLLSANHEDGKWQGVEVKRGQLITGRKRISEETGLSEQTIRSGLKRLKSTNEITIKSTSRFSLITICNYNSYNAKILESNQLNTQQVTSNQPASNQQVTTNKNDKNDKNDKKKKRRFAPPSLSEVETQIAEKNYKNITADRFVNFYGSKGWMVGKNKMTDWRKALARAENWDAPSGVGNQTSTVDMSEQFERMRKKGML